MRAPGATPLRTAGRTDLDGDVGEEPLRYDAVVLAGGRARRLGGASKPDVLVGGRRMLAHVLDAVGTDAPGRRVVVVAPAGVAVPAGVLRTLEDPPDGGPVAGIDAGLAGLDATRPGGAAPWVLLLACDVPRVAGAVPRLVAAARSATDGVMLVDPQGRDQPLVGLYRRGALDASLARLGAAGLRGAPVRRLVDGLDVVRLGDPDGDGADVDTWEDRRALDPTAPDEG